MTKFKLAMAAALAVSSIAVTVPAAAMADPYHHDRMDRHDRHGGWDHRRGDGVRHRGGRVRVCRNVRIHHHWERVCHWEARRW